MTTRDDLINQASAILSTAISRWRHGEFDPDDPAPHATT